MFENIQSHQRTVLFSSLLLLQACASSTKPGIAPVPVEDRSVENDSSGALVYPAGKHKNASVDGERAVADTRNNSSNTVDQPVLIALLEDADLRIQAGDNISAAASLERALRLDPKNAMLWHRLGLLRLRQKNWQQAINLAKKSNSLAAGQYQLQIENWKLISDANLQAGNKAAAELASERARQLQ